MCYMSTCFYYRNRNSTTYKELDRPKILSTSAILLNFHYGFNLVLIYAKWLQFYPDGIVLTLQSKNWGVCTFVQHAVQRYSVKLGRAIENHPNLSCFVGVVHPVVRCVPHFPVIGIHLFQWDFTRVTFGHDICHEGLVIFRQPGVSFKLFLQPVGALQGLWFVVGYGSFTILNGKEIW